MKRDESVYYPHIPWQDIAGMRDKLVRDYFGVDVEEVWLAATNDIPVLKAKSSQDTREVGDTTMTNDR